MNKIGGKRCSLCKTIKPLTDFRKNKNSPDGYGYRCRPCLIVERRERIERFQAQAEAIRATMTAKVCRGCGLEKSLNEFQLVRGEAKDGLSIYCFDCIHIRQRDYYAENRDKHLAKMRIYKSTHIEEIKRHSKEYCDKYREEIRAYGRDYYAENREEVLEKRKTMPSVKKAQNDYRRRKYGFDAIYTAAHGLRRRQDQAVRMWLDEGHITEAGTRGRKAKHIDFKGLIDHLGPCPGVWGMGATNDVYHLDHIIPLRQLRLDVSDIAWAIAAHPRNCRWLKGKDNYDKSYEITTEAYELVCELYLEITGEVFDSEVAKEIFVSQDEKVLDKS